jgi:tripartite-type tricarboxylate transporter receptor subunit TctC
MFAPAGTSREIVDRLQSEAKRAFDTPEVTRRMKVEGTDVVINTPAEFAGEVRGELDRWRTLVKKTGVKF